LTHDETTRLPPKHNTWQWKNKTAPQTSKESHGATALCQLGDAAMGKIGENEGIGGKYDV